MTPDPVSITPDTSVEDAARLMLKHKIGGLPIMENGELVGIISTTDILRAFLSMVQATEQITSELERRAALAQVQFRSRA